MMEPVNEKSQFDRLLAQMTEEGLSSAERERLGKLIAGDTELRSQYLEYCQMHALLRSEHGLLTAISTPANQAERRSFLASCREMSWPAVLSWASAACALIAAAGIFIWLISFEHVPYRGAETAVLSKVAGARFHYGVDGNPTPAEGVRLRQGLYELLGGCIEIQYDSGATLVLRAPATFHLVDQVSVQLEDGQLSAHVPPAATGFRIETPGATVTDLGTDFAIQAVKNKESEVHVFQGEVIVDLHGEKVKPADRLRLVTGEAARVDFFTGIPSGIDLNTKQFLRILRDESSTYAQQMLDLKPAVYYRMEPTSDGSRLIDSSPNSADATIHFGRGNVPVWTAGRIGAAFTLGGPAEQTYAAARRYPQAEEDKLSVVAWVYANSRPRWASIAKNWAGGDENHGQFHFGLYEDSGELEAHISDGMGQEIILHDEIPIPLHTWHHVAFVADGNAFRLYRNGFEVDSQPYRKLHRDPRIRALAIGTKLNLAGTEPEETDFNMWDGRLDELAIFNHALTDIEIRQLYESASSEE